MNYEQTNNISITLAMKSLNTLLGPVKIPLTILFIVVGGGGALCGTYETYVKKFQLMRNIMLKTYQINHYYNLPGITMGWA